ncbi:hypothetical protein N339_03103, partial [Pterocles gutturalis]
RNIGLAKSRVRTLNFRRANFQLFKELLDGIPWETVLKGIGAEQSWQLFKDTLLRAQELSIPQQKKLSKGGGQPAWPSKDLQLKLKKKREMYRKWKQGCVAWEEYRGVVGMCRDRIRKHKAQMELNLVRDGKNNKKGFYRYIGRRRQSKESVPPLINEKGELASSDMEKAEVLSKCFASVFTGGRASHVCQDPEPLGEGERSGIPPTVTVEQV